MTWKKIILFAVAGAVLCAAATTTYYMGVWGEYQESKYLIQRMKTQSLLRRVTAETFHQPTYQPSDEFMAEVIEREPRIVYELAQNERQREDIRKLIAARSKKELEEYLLKNDLPVFTLQRGATPDQDQVTLNRQGKPIVSMNRDLEERWHDGEFDCFRR